MELLRGDLISLLTVYQGKRANAPVKLPVVITCFFLLEDGFDKGELATHTLPLITCILYF